MTNMEPHSEQVLDPKLDVQHHERQTPDNNDIKEKVEEIQSEEAAQHLNVIDFELLSRESIRFKSKATIRLLLVIIIQGISSSLRSFYTRFPLQS